MPDPSDLTRITDLARALGHRPGPADADQDPAQAPARVDDLRPSSHKERRDRIAARIYEHWNPGHPWADAHPDDLIAYGADADVAMAAADAWAGRTLPAPTRGDAYVEVADRLALFAGTREGMAATTAQVSEKVRTWADHMRGVPGTAAPQSSLTTFLAEVAAERGRQDEKWGEQHHPDGTGSASQQVAAGAARARCQVAAEQGEVTWRLILAEEHAEAMAESDPAALRAELVQVAAVCAAWIFDLDSRGAKAAADGPCTQHPHAPTFDGRCGGCTVYPADMLPPQASTGDVLGGQG
ncbi:hypothetical protein ACFW91_25080 [Streptomyces asoensis]|uniref:hypothetical protein n=1 Tax=Streptomyces asoensis TaxID=249586 RepID=UPI0036BDE9D0